MKQNGIMRIINIKIGPLLYVTLVFLLSAILFASIYDLFFRVNETTGFLFIFSIPAILILSLLSILVWPHYYQWHDRRMSWAFLLGNALAVWILGLGFTYIWLVFA